MDMTMESCRKFVEVLASDAPAPGGGGAAALVGAIGTAPASGYQGTAPQGTALLPQFLRMAAQAAQALL